MKVVKMFLVSVVLSWSFIGHVHTPVCVEYRKLHILVPSDCKIAYNVPHLANQKSNGIAEICWSIFRAYCVKLVIVCVCVCVMMIVRMYDLGFHKVSPLCPLYLKISWYSMSVVLRPRLDLWRLANKFLLSRLNCLIHYCQYLTGI